MENFQLMAKETRINEYQNIFEVKIDADLYMMSIKSGYCKGSDIDIYIWNDECWLPVDPKPYELKRLARDLEILFGKRFRRVVNYKKYGPGSQKKHFQYLKEFQEKRTK